MNYEYDVAISFAGEDRTIAQQIANLLVANGIKVFYDEFEEATLWGEDLYVHLQDVYSVKARFCIMLLSQHYAKKAWTNHERQSAQERAFKESQAYILPVRLDSTSIPGIRDTVGYISLASKTVEDVVNLTLTKLGKTKNAGVSASPRSSVAKVILPSVKQHVTERDKDRFVDEAFAAIRTYFKEGARQLNDMQGIEVDLKEITSTKFMCKAYVHGATKSACTIWYGGSSMMGGGIKYVSVADPDAGSSMNEILSVEVRGTELVLKPMMNMFGQRNSLLNKNGAAEYLWQKFIEPLNR
jgi:hypothetical protein